MTFQKNAIDSEYGYSAGGVIVLNMKSGTNTFHGTGIADFRSPTFNALTDPTLRPFPTFDVRNNVIYDYGEIASGLTQGVLKVNYVGNYIRPGPSSNASTPIRVGGPSDLRFYIKDNIFEGNKALTEDNSQFFDPVIIDGKRQVQTVAQQFEAPPVKTVAAIRLLEMVLATVGASLPRRDLVDAGIVSEVRERKGSIIDSQRQVGGWPELRSTAAPKDSDGDGMPDDWERRYGLNPHDASDANRDKDGDGYTNLEEYLNGTDPNNSEPSQSSRQE